MESVIVRYEGELRGAVNRAIPQGQVVELFHQYAIVTIPVEDLTVLRELAEVEYVELPKRLYFSDRQANSASCITLVQQSTLGREMRSGLTGNGVLIGIIDSGIDYTHPDFITEEGESRIVYLWDQSVDRDSGVGIVPEGFVQGAEYTGAQITDALRLPTEQRQQQIPETDRDSGHGTAVAGVAAGNGRGAVAGEYTGVATDSSLIVVKLAQRDDGFPRTTEVMEGLDYVLRKAIQLQRPVAVNLSFGNNYGPHDGQSLFENYITELNGVWKNVIVVASGNEGDARHHTEKSLPKGEFTGSDASKEQRISFAVGEAESRLVIQLWKNYVDQMQLRVESPGGESYLVPTEGRAVEYDLSGAVLRIVHGNPTPYTITQEVYFEWIGNRQFIPGGVWDIRVRPEKIRDGILQLWMTGVEGSGSQTGFLDPVTNTTLTIPATAARIISVGAYNSNTEVVASFSGRGFTADHRVAPTLVAPGIEIMTARPGGGYQRVSGTSIAAPFVTGSAALLMEWGIIRGNDPELYGEKVKAYLSRGARPLPGIREYPDKAAGWGALCLERSIP